MPEVSKNVNVAYSCGKLFAVYEDLQYRYHRKRNKSVKPLSANYFNAALRRPGQTFTYLAEICNAYLNGVQPGVAAFYSSMIGELSEEIGTAFPSSFNSDETGSFALGYYQQKASFIKNRRKDGAEENNEETDEETNE